MQRDSAQHTKLLDILFNMPPEPAIEFVFDFVPGSSALMPSTHATTAGAAAAAAAVSLSAPLHFQQLVYMKVFDTCTHIFRTHAAVLLSTEPRPRRHREKPDDRKG